MRKALYYAVTALATFVFSLLSLIGALVRAPHRWFDMMERGWAGSILWSLGARVEVEGLQHSDAGRGQILVANHQSMCDIWALMVAIPASLRFVAKAELSRIPLFAGACRVAGHVFIDRRRPSRAGDAIRAAGRRLREEGLTLVMFAEGTRSRDGRLGSFRKGAFALAIETGAHLVPTAIDGGYEVLPPGGGPIRPGTIRVRLAPGVPLAGLSAEDRDALVDSTHATVARMLEALREERAATAAGLAPPNP